MLIDLLKFKPGYYNMPIQVKKPPRGLTCLSCEKPVFFFYSVSRFLKFTKQFPC